MASIPESAEKIEVEKAFRNMRTMQWCSIGKRSDTGARTPVRAGVLHTVAYDAHADPLRGMNDPAYESLRLATEKLKKLHRNTAEYDRQAVLPDYFANPDLGISKRCWRHSGSSCEALARNASRKYQREC